MRPSTDEVLEKYYNEEISVEEAVSQLSEIHVGGGKGLKKRIYFTKYGHDKGEAKGEKYWKHERGKAVAKAVASTVATEIIPGGTAINAARWGRHAAKHFFPKVRKTAAA